MATILGLLPAKVRGNRSEHNIMTPEFSVRTILRLIFFVYVYMMLMASANVVNCETKKTKECGDQWTQAFTVSSGAVTTLWAFITDNPVQTGRKTPGGRPPSAPVTPPEPITSGQDRSRKRS